MTAASTDYPGTVAVQNYAFTVIVQHCVVSIMSLPVIPLVVKPINMGPASTVFSPATWSNLNCLYTASYSATYAKAGVSIPAPYWSSLDGPNLTLTFDPI